MSGVLASGEPPSSPGGARVAGTRTTKGAGGRRERTARPAAHVAYVALGGNLGDVLATFRAALDVLARRGLDVVAVSPAYRTEALVAPGTPGPVPDYWNAVVEARTTLAPRELLALLQSVEAELGRVRRERWASRTLDLDIVLFDELAVDEPGLAVPHPRMAERPFVLRPLADIAAGVPVPGRSATVGGLLGRLPDPDRGILERRVRWRDPADRDGGG